MFTILLIKYFVPLNHEDVILKAGPELRPHRTQLYFYGRDFTLKLSYCPLCCFLSGSEASPNIQVKFPNFQLHVRRDPEVREADGSVLVDSSQS